MKYEKKILVTGGAGYIGNVLCRLLLEKGYHVRVLDRLLFGGDALLDLLNHVNFEFVKGDTRIKEDRNIALDDVEAVVHLAAIVGDPACAKNSRLAEETNLIATKALYNEANLKGVRRFVFASTCSNYGKMKDPGELVNENSELRPVSLYAETKVAAELFLLGQNIGNVCKPVCLRFATAYGLSSRLRFDLTVNEFAKDLAMEKELIVFGEQFWRPYCHVFDLARAVVLAIEAPDDKIAFGVFNVGDTDENYTKKMLVEEIMKQLPGAKVKYVQKNEDPRDYKVSFKKISGQLGFEITKTVPQGIQQVIGVIKTGMLTDPDAPKYKNT